jgi:hypothetical protein
MAVNVFETVTRETVVNALNYIQLLFRMVCTLVKNFRQDI